VVFHFFEIGSQLLWLQYKPRSENGDVEIPDAFCRLQLQNAFETREKRKRPVFPYRRKASTAGCNSKHTGERCFCRTPLLPRTTRELGLPSPGLKRVVQNSNAVSNVPRTPATLFKFAGGLTPAC